MFKHALVHEAAYQSLLQSTRAEYHLRVARALETHFPRTVEGEPETLAWHYAQAGKSEPAIDYWQRAGARAVSSAEALGLTQVIPPTADGIAAALAVEDFTYFDLFRPNVSIRSGAYYSGTQLQALGGDERAAVAAHHRGPRHPDSGPPAPPGHRAGVVDAVVRVDGAIVDDQVAPSGAAGDDARLERIHLAYRGLGPLRVEAGDDYVAFGHGVALSLRKVDPLGLDTSLQGGRIDYLGSGVRATVLGGRTNPQNLDPIELRVVDDVNDLLAGGELSVDLGDAGAIGPFRRADRASGLSAYHPAEGRPKESAGGPPVKPLRLSFFMGAAAKVPRLAAFRGRGRFWRARRVAVGPFALTTRSQVELEIFNGMQAERRRWLETRNVNLPQ